MKKRILSIILVVAFAMSMVMGCGSNSGTSDDSKSNKSEEDDYCVQIPISTSLCSAPMQIAVINGYFDEVGLNWEEVNLGDNSSLDFVATGKADVSYDLLQTLVQRIASGLDYSVVMGVHYGCINIIAGKDTGIQSVADLKGKKIGCPTSLGSDPSVMLQRVLTDAGIGCTADNMEVDMQVFANSDLETALTNGTIDAFVSWDPYASLVAKRHDDPIIWSQTTSDLTKDEYCCFLGFRSEFVDEHPDLVQKVCKAINMSCEFIQENPEEAAKLQVDNNYVSSDDLELNAELLKSYNYTCSVDKGKESFATCAQSLQDLGIISLKQSIEEFTDQYYRAVDGVDY